jgi:hypothetical protein
VRGDEADPKATLAFLDTLGINGARTTSLAWNQARAG